MNWGESEENWQEDEELKRKTCHCYPSGNILQISLLNVRSSIPRSVLVRHSYIRLNKSIGLFISYFRVALADQSKQLSSKSSRRRQGRRVEGLKGLTVIIHPTSDPDFYFLSYYILQEIWRWSRDWFWSLIFLIVFVCLWWWVHYCYYMVSINWWLNSVNGGSLVIT